MYGKEAISAVGLSMCRKAFWRMMPENGKSTSFRLTLFTPIHRSMGLVNLKSGPYKFWKSMLDGKHKIFPNKVLVPMGGTLKDFIKKVSGGEK